MDGARHGAELEQLLAEIGWVQRIARGLVRDAAGAEDLAQEALVRSLDQRAHAPSSPGPLRAWLATLVRRLAIDRGRADASRAARESSHAARSRRETDAPHDIVARSERQQALVRAVHALSEPYRTTILLRYLDELAPREIAERMHVDEALVRKRLSRGLAQLRERLADQHDDVATWLVALIGPADAAGIGALSSATSAPTTGVLFMSTKFVAGLAALVLVGFVTWRFTRDVESPTVLSARAETPAQLHLEPEAEPVPSRPHAESAALAVLDEHPAREARAAPESEPARDGAPSAAMVRPHVEGTVRVDGVVRIPPHFEITGWPDAELRTDTARGTYRYGPGPARRLLAGSDPMQLSVRSDETILRKLEVPSDAVAFSADLELSIGRTLDIFVLRAPDEAPHADFGLDLDISVTTQRSLAASFSSSDSRKLRTDASGHARATGLPRDGFLRLWRSDATTTKDGKPRHGRTVWSYRIDELSPARIEAQLVLGAQPASITLRGRVSQGVCARGVVQAQPADPNFARSEESTAAIVDGDGRFALHVEPRTTWDVWAECSGDRITEIERVTVRDTDVDAIELRARSRQDVALEVVRVPAGAKLNCIVSGERPTRVVPLTVADGHASTTLALDRAVLVQVDASYDDGLQQMRRTLLVDVDPSRTHAVSVDLRGDALREVEIVIAGPADPGPTQLVLKRLVGAVEPRESSVCAIVDRRSVRPCVLPPGRWAWLCRGGFGGFALGIVDIGDGTEPVRLEARLVSHPRAELGAGVEVLDVGGIVPSWFLLGGRFEMRWANLPESLDRAELWLPENLRYRVLAAR